MPPDPDLLAAELARIRDCNEERSMPSGDLRKALKALRRVKALAEQWYGERGNDYSASALFASKLREVLGEELLGKGEGDG
jgi:Cdc6-like AAA superfamily ATPase